MEVTVKELEHDFMAVQPEVWPVIQTYLERAHYEECNHNIVCMLLWLDWYPLFYFKTENYMILLGIHEGEFFTYMPLCTPEYFEEALRKAKSIFDHYGHRFVLACYTKEAMERVLEIFPDYQAVSIRDQADYVYETAKLISFSGKALQKKRNHLNAFYREYEGRWVYESLTRENLEECREYLAGWHTDDANPEVQEDRTGTNRILDLFGKIPYRGGLIRIDGKVRAFAIGSVLSDRMCQENIEKADDEFRGLYQAIMREFLSHEFPDYQYVNREDDMGEENLRHAKEAYHPAFMIEKYRICEEGQAV